MRRLLLVSLLLLAGCGAEDDLGTRTVTKEGGLERAQVVLPAGATDVLVDDVGGSQGWHMAIRFRAPAAGVERFAAREGVRAGFRPPQVAAQRWREEGWDGGPLEGRTTLDTGAETRVVGIDRRRRVVWVFYGST